MENTFQWMNTIAYLRNHLMPQQKFPADQLALGYYNSYDTKVKIVRPFNCLWTQTISRAVIPNMILQILDIQRKYLKEKFKIKTYREIKDLCSALVNI